MKKPKGYRRDGMTKYYICDRKKCERCVPECRHTADVMHARDDDLSRAEFVLYNSGLYQVDRKKDQKKRM